jgi:hypothetical protein
MQAEVAHHSVEMHLQRDGGPSRPDQSYGWQATLPAIGRAERTCNATAAIFIPPHRRTQNVRCWPAVEDRKNCDRNVWNFRQR